jgi:hypothetical protein
VLVEALLGPRALVRPVGSEPGVEVSEHLGGALGGVDCGTAEMNTGGAKDLGEQEGGADQGKAGRGAGSESERSDDGGWVVDCRATGCAMEGGWVGCAS